MSSSPRERQGSKTVRVEGLEPTTPSIVKSDHSGKTISSPLSPTDSVETSRRKARATNVNVKVMVRVRPFSQGEIDMVKRQGTYMQSVIDMQRSDQVQLLDHEKNYHPKQAFNFDTVLWSVSPHQQQSPIGFSDQERVYMETGSISLDAAWEGINSCIFAYGQTGSGKTHTMMGDPASITKDGGCSADEAGVIPRLCKQLFNEKEEREMGASLVGLRKTIEVELIFIEIYNEQVYDLLIGTPVTNFVRGRGQRRRSAATERRLSATEHLPAMSSGGTQHTSGSPPGDQTRFLSTNSTDGLKSPLSPGNRSGDHQKHQKPPWGEEHNEKQRLEVREHPTEGPQVVGVTVCQPASYDEIIRAINYGNKERHVAATKLNDRSSRSHAMFRITLRQLTHVERERAGVGAARVDTSERRANMNLVDLAGSENTKRSGVTGATMVEAQKINLSLTTLRRVIDALIDKKSGHPIPYRDSTLTWLLRQDLGGNSRCFMLATVSPHHCNAHESQRTLEYAMRARSIVNAVKVNEDDTARMLRDLEKRLEEKQRLLVTEEATEEQRAQLQREIDHAKHDADEIQSRLRDLDSHAEEVKRQEKELRREKARQTLRLVAKVARISAAKEQRAQEVEKQNIEMDRIRKAALQAGHRDIDDMAASLKMKRDEILKLTQNKDKMEKQTTTMRERERQLEEQHEREKAELLISIEALMGRRDETANTLKSNVDTVEQRRLQKIKEVEEMYSKQVKNAEERHEQVLGQVAEDSHEHVVQLQNELDRVYHHQVGVLQRQIDSAKREQRDVREDGALKLRGVQDAEIELRGQVAWCRQEAEKSRADLSLLKGFAQEGAAKVEARLRVEEQRAARAASKLKELEREALEIVRTSHADQQRLQSEYEGHQTEGAQIWESLELLSVRARASDSKFQRAENRIRHLLEAVEAKTIDNLEQAKAFVDDFFGGCRNVTSVKPVLPGRGTMSSTAPRLDVSVTSQPPISKENGDAAATARTSPVTPGSARKGRAVSKRRRPVQGGTFA